MLIGIRGWYAEQMKNVSKRLTGRLPGSARAVVGLMVGLLVALNTSVVSIDDASASVPAVTVASAGVQLQALTIPANPTVGPLYSNGLDADHTCTASVLSAGRDLLVTAAHCLAGSATGIKFIPGYDGTAATAAPYGVWAVSQAWVPAGWANGQNEQDDYAILQVADNVVNGQGTSLNELVGGNAIGVAIDGSGAVTVPAYVDGSHDAPISCTAALYVEQGFPSFGCGGYVSGTSGAPWIEQYAGSSDSAVVGVIGGLHEGGCTDSTSYSSEFNTDVYLLLIRAVIGLPSDTPPIPPTDGC